MRELKFLIFIYISADNLSKNDKIKDLIKRLEMIGKIIK
jgi:hypothetical protein